MKKCYLAPSFIELERALIKEVQAFKDEFGIFQRAMILVPSSPLCKHLKIKLSKKMNCLINVDILPFMAFIENICGTVFDEIPHEEGERSILRLLGEGKDFEGWEGVVLQRLRDLSDSAIEPDQIREILNSLHRNKDFEIINLFIKWRELVDKFKIRDYSSKVKKAQLKLKENIFFHRIKRFFLYGFYDLTGVMADFIDEILFSKDFVIFFPALKNHKFYEFSQSFYDWKFDGRVREKIEMGINAGAFREFIYETLNEESFEKNKKLADNIHLINASGEYGEVQYVAKEILKLINKEGYNPSEIALIARSIEEYREIIKKIFRENFIPFSSPRKVKAHLQPLVRLFYNFIELIKKNCHWVETFEILMSPFFNIDASMQERGLWKFIAIKKGIIKADDWERIKDLKYDFIIQRTQDDDKEEKPIVLPKESLEKFCENIEKLRNLTGKFKGKEKWEYFCRIILEFIDSFVIIKSASDKEIIESIKKSINKLPLLQKIEQEEIEGEIFLNSFKRILDNIMEDFGGKGKGVQIMDVMTARGMTFKVIFIIGLNKDSFPRRIIEDPFLEDSLKKTLIDIGAKLSTSETQFLEEKLLFILTALAAGEKIYLLWQRSDEKGKIREPSIFIEKILNAVKEDTSLILFPRDEEKQINYEKEKIFLNPYEVSAIISRKKNHSQNIFWQLRGISPLWVRHSISVSDEIERRDLSPGPYDGILEKDFITVQTESISSTSLETLFQCPFKFFIKYILKISPLPLLEFQFELLNIDEGDIVHKLLKNLYSEISKKRITSLNEALSLASKNLCNYIEEYKKQNPNLFEPSLKATKDRIFSYIENALKVDFEEVLKNYFVLDTEKYFDDAILKIGDIEFKIDGKIDRIDKNLKEKKHRVIDYKTGKVFKILKKDNLTLEEPPKFQLPFYIEALRNKENLEGEIDALYWFLKDNKTEGFSSKEWDSKLKFLYEPVFKTLYEILKNGLFFITPSNHCDYCDYFLCCRMRHYPSKIRLKKLFNEGKHVRNSIF